MSRNDEAIKLLVESIKGRDYLVIDADAYDKAISLLKQPCQEEVEVENLETGEKATMIIDKPCDYKGDIGYTSHGERAIGHINKPRPDCDEAELVKELREVGEKLKKLSFHRAIFNQKPDTFLRYGGLMVKSADIIERLQAKLSSYTIIEELGPPDLPKKKFVEMLINTWEEKNREAGKGMLEVANNIRILSSDIHNWAKEKGHWQKENCNDGEKIALMHSELSELLESLRKPDADKHCPEFGNAEIEAADVLIRILDFSAFKGWRLGEALLAKMAFNETRPYKHGKKF